MYSGLIKTEQRYAAALLRLEALMGAAAGTPEADELELLALLIGTYEDQRYPQELPTPAEAIRFRIEQMGLRQKDLVPYLGSASRVSEVLNGKRALTLSMMRALHEGLGIPPDVLLRQRGKLPTTRTISNGSGFPCASWGRGAGFRAVSRA
ncbi:MAG: helix-turn-helix domain-containing protein [bacterium]|nr:helix-turn-helix domain-containing protein [bacterium]